MLYSRKLKSHYRLYSYCLLAATLGLLFTLFRNLDITANLSIGDTNSDIQSQYQLFIDSNSQFTPQQVLSSEFQTVDIRHPPVNFGPYTYWYKLNISNQSDKPRQLVLFFDNPMIDNIKLYHWSDNQVSLKKELGDHILSSALDMALPSFTFTQAPQQQSQWLISSQTLGAPNLPIIIFEQEPFEQYQFSLFALWGCFIGICLLMAIYNLILFWGVGDKLYLLYTGYVISVLITLGMVHGYHYFLFPLAVAKFLSPYIISFNYSIAIFTLLFALYFLRYDKDNGHLFKFGYWFALVMLPLAIFSVFVKEYQAAAVFFVLQTLLYCFSLLLLYRKFYQGYKWTKYYFISWLPLYVGAAVGPLMLSGNLEYNFWTRHAFLLSVAFEMTFISMALADRLRILEQQKLENVIHDHTHGMPNKAFLKQLLSQRRYLTATKLLLINISNYQQLRPYLTAEQEKAFLLSICLQLEQKLKNHFQLHEIELKAKHGNYCCLLTEDTLAYVIDVPQNIEAQALQVELTAPIPFASNGLSLAGNCSAGLSASNLSAQTLNQCISQAQQALQLNLTSGQSVTEYQHQIAERGKRRALLAAELQLAIKQQSLQLYHQPQINLCSGKIHGSEVLLRWPHSELGFVPPDEFIAIAEETGLVHELSLMVINKACEQQLQLQAFSPMLSINLSTQNICHPVFCQQMGEVIQGCKLEASSITLEITETFAIDDNLGFKHNLQWLADQGFNIAIDDFGTGFASLSYINDHPFNKLKLDKSFVTQLLTTERHRTITQTTVNMANDLGLEAIAEGIEDLETALLLKQYRCPVGQGYYFSQPMPISDYKHWLREYDQQELAQKLAGSFDPTPGSKTHHVRSSGIS